MKKVKSRTLMIWLIVFAIVIGFGVYLFRYITKGEAWATFSGNESVYSEGVLTTGTVLDRNGVILSGVSDDYRYYSDDYLTRVANLHAVGDLTGNIGTGALSAFSSELIGYNIINGTYSMTGKGRNLYLTVDSYLNNVAYEALAGRSGTVAVCNYETGEILCMASSPSYDPNGESGADVDGAYINRFLSSSYTPGSIFKLVTMVAAIENIPDLYERTFTCNGSCDVGGDTVTCTDTHGELTIDQALAVSCNCVFAELALELGGDTLKEYADKLGVTEEIDIDGIMTTAGNFDAAADGTANLAWSGIGQYTDTVNPASYLRFVSAIANGGEAKDLSLINDVEFSSGLSTRFLSRSGSTQLISEDTARQLSDLMGFNVSYNYGTDNYPGLELHAKSGTAEVGDDQSPHAWFTGFITNENYPLAFIVVVENGGWGSAVAGEVANTVMQAAITRDFG